MQPSYVSKVVVETEFDAQKVRVELRQLSWADSLKLKQFLRPVVGTDTSTAEPEVFVEYAAMLQRYLRGETGLKEADGTPVPVEALAETFFVPFVTVLMMKHLAAARAADPTPPAELRDASSAGYQTASESSLEA